MFCFVLGIEIHRNAVSVHNKKIFSAPVRKKITFIVPVQTNFYCTYHILVKFKHFAELNIVKYLTNVKQKFFSPFTISPVGLLLSINNSIKVSIPSLVSPIYIISFTYAI